MLIAATIIGLTVVGVVLAIVFDLPTDFVVGEAQSGDLGIEVIWQGSAVSAPLPPIVGIVLGAALAMRAGTPRVVGLALLTLVGLVMMVGVVGEFTSEIPHTGARRAAVVIVNVIYAVLAVSLVATSLRAIVNRASGAAREQVSEG